MVGADVDVVKKKKHSRLVVAYLEKLTKINQLIDITEKYNPESLESFDRQTLMLGLYLPDIAKKVHRNLISFLWDFRREAEESLLHGLPVFIHQLNLLVMKKEIQANR